MDRREIEVECRGRLGLVTVALQPFNPFEAPDPYYYCFLESVPIQFDKTLIEKAVQRECNATIGPGRWLYFQHRPDLKAPDVLTCKATNTGARNTFTKAVSRIGIHCEELSDRLVDFIHKFFIVTLDGLSLLGRGLDKVDQNLAAELLDYWQNTQHDNRYERLAGILSQATSDQKVDWHTDINYRYLVQVSCGSKTRTMLKKLKFCRLLSDITNGLIPEWGQACACLVYNAIKVKRYKASEYYKMNDQETALAARILLEMFKIHEFEINISKDAWLEHPVWFHSFIRKTRASIVCMEFGIDGLTSLDIQADIDKFDLAKFGVDIGLPFSTVLAGETIHGMSAEIDASAERVTIHFGRLVSYGSADVLQIQSFGPVLQAQTAQPIDTCQEVEQEVHKQRCISPYAGSIRASMLPDLYLPDMSQSLYDSNGRAPSQIIPPPVDDCSHNSDFCSISSMPVNTVLLAKHHCHPDELPITSDAVLPWPIPPVGRPRYFSIRPTAIADSSSFEPCGY